MKMYVVQSFCSRKRNKPSVAVTFLSKMSARELVIGTVIKHSFKTCSSMCRAEFSSKYPKTQQLCL